jgi:hypothetical protein
MYRLKNHNIVLNISKIVSWFMALLFIISWSYSFDVVPLNFLSNWVNKVEKNIEINGAK